MFSLSTLLVALAATSAWALPLGDSHLKERSCSLSTARLQLPPGQTSLAVAARPPAYVTLGVGVQVCAPFHFHFAILSSCPEFDPKSCYRITPASLECGPLWGLLRPYMTYRATFTPHSLTSNNPPSSVPSPPVPNQSSAISSLPMERVVHLLASISSHLRPRGSTAH